MSKYAGATVDRRCPQTLSELKRALEFGNALGVRRIIERNGARYPQEHSVSQSEPKGLRLANNKS